MELTEEVKALLLNTAQELKGSTRRMFMARTVQALGEGGQRLAERELNWNRGTIRKGMLRLWRAGACVWMASDCVGASAVKITYPTC
jgi:hypothetical protein